MILAHGVGRLYELPIPLYLYLFGATATVVASFVIRVLAPDVPAARAERLVAGSGPPGS